MNKKATINEVARQANVSIATVSRYLSNNGYPIKEETKEKIELAIKALDYTPNYLGRMLKTNKSMDIGVIIPTILNPYYPAVILGIENLAREKGYNILLCNSKRDKTLQKQYIDTLIQKQIKGLIISSIGDEETLFHDIVKKGIGLVSLEEEAPIDGVGQVLFNYQNGAYLAIRHLIEQGHRKIAFLTSPLNKKSRNEILQGYSRCLNDYKLDYYKVIENKQENEYENGIMLAKLLMAEKHLPTAVLAVNDMAAYGIMQYLMQNGIRIPEDMSIIGFDDLIISKMMNPPLTTVRQPSEMTGELAASMLFDILEGQQARKIVLEPELIIRASTKKI
ncbi:MAG: LacI family DNA-binding transcriptional regulator [Clostridia bacterium]|nr:LacI family DNA-binding transcriptional regulator [Clostridia bacterium]